MKQKNNLSDQIILLITELAGAPRRIGANSVGNKLDQPFSCLDKNSFPIKSSSSHFPNDSHSFFFPQPTSLLNSYPSFFVSRPKRSLDRDNVRGSWLFILFQCRISAGTRSKPEIPFDGRNLATRKEREGLKMLAFGKLHDAR